MLVFFFKMNVDLRIFKISVKQASKVSTSFSDLSMALYEKSV